MPDFDRSAHFDLNRGHAVDRAVEHIIVHPVAAIRYCEVPGRRKVLRVGAFAKGVSGLARNPHHPRRRLDRAGNAKRRNKTPLSLGRPAIMANALHWRGREVREDARVGAGQYGVFVVHSKLTSDQILFCKHICSFYVLCGCARG